MMPADVVSRDKAEHYRWGGKDGSESDGWYLVRSDAVHVIEEQMPAGAEETRHLHVRARQFFYVLAGEMTIEVEHHLFQVRTGEGIEVAPGQAHQAMNRATGSLRILVTSAPPSHGDRVETA